MKKRGSAVRARIVCRFSWGSFSPTLPCYLLSLLLVFGGLLSCPAWALPSAVEVSLFEYLPGLKYVRFPQSVVLLEPRKLALEAVEVLPLPSANSGQLRRFGRDFALGGRSASNSASAAGTTSGVGERAGVRPVTGARAGSASGSGLVAREFLFRSLKAGEAIKVEAGNGTRTVRRSYRGTLRVRFSQGQVRVINRVDLRDYLVSVVGSESLPNFQLEALKAQAVLASNVLLQEMAEKASGGSHATLLKDSTQTQAYLGATYERPLARSAVQAVFPQVLQAAEGAKLQPVYYHSTCGGGTSLPEDVFAHGKEGAASEVVSRPALSEQTRHNNGKSSGQAVACHFCKASPFYKNLVEVLDCAQVRDKLGFLPLAILARDKAGRPLKVLVEDARGNQRQITGYALWLALGQNFGWGKVPGTRFDFKQEKDKLKFTSSGCGHGAGFCQWGAQGMALAGRNYRQILEYYFPGAWLKNQ